MYGLWSIFGSICLLAFAIGMVVGGGFTTYFGSGKSRIVGGILTAIGIIALIFFIWMSYAPSYWDWGIVAKGVVGTVGAIVGGAIALGIFLVGIMKA
jgi:hypothetical protein